jgi:hypothetical protein
MARLSRSAAPAKMDQRCNVLSCAAVMVDSPPRILYSLALKSMTCHPQAAY